MPQNKVYSNLVFDLDGTLSNPQVGICNGIRYALTSMGVHPSPSDDFTGFIGASLHHSFQTRYFPDPHQTARAVAYFRSYYAEKGLFENFLYEGIPELLNELVKRYSLFVLTNKPKPFADRILNHFGLSSCFTAIAGVDLVKPTAFKAELVPGLIASHPFLLPDATLMIGDTIHDVVCARSCGWDILALTWGFGREDDFRNSPPDAMVHSVKELRTVLLPATDGVSV